LAAAALVTILVPAAEPRLAVAVQFAATSQAPRLAEEAEAELPRPAEAAEAAASACAPAPGAAEAPLSWAASSARKA
jgi:hypothetical protein